MTTLDQIVATGTKLTPMMQQYYGIKKEHPGTILFFRMGDFYEVFFEDANESAKLLNITLTHRGKLGDTPIPMAGIPHHSASSYIDRLTAQGKKVAICEQVSDPKDAKGIVERAVTQVVSPGIPYDMDRAQKNEHQYICSAFQHEKKYYLSALDFTTGDFYGHQYTSSEQFLEKIRFYSPREFIQFLGQWESTEIKDSLPTLLDHMNTLITHLSSEYFEEKYSKIYIESLIPSYKSDKTIHRCRQILSSIGPLSYYICSTQGEKSFYHIKPFQLTDDSTGLKATTATLMGLEILPRSNDNKKNSLLGYFNKTMTAGGARFLKHVFQNPLADKEKIEQRQRVIQYFLDHDEIHTNIREEISDIRDIERILAKLSTGKATASDLINIKKSIQSYQLVLSELTAAPVSLGHKLKKSDIDILKRLQDSIEKQINDEVGASLEKGNLIKPGANKKRDRLAKLSVSTQEELSALEERYRNETKIPKLRIKSNNVAGYFIEISKLHSNKVPAYFDRRQTLVNSERYTTEELTLFENEVLSSKEKLERLERELFRSIVSDLNEQSLCLQKLAHSISSIDFHQSLAWLAKQEGLIPPTIVEEKCFIVEGMWHPLIKTTLKDQFVCHDLELNESNYFGLITGPNMAGKTTVMREVAIIQHLTQIGSYVPAKKVTVGLCDYLFSRLGASDDILKGQSTFMVEMTETAEIIRHATRRSLIILDEIGRGTSTYDGLSIAWALSEHLIRSTKALTLFASHYHELIDVIENEPGAKNLTVETLNDKGKVQFLYRLLERGASQSYGLHVAKMAGFPRHILNRGQKILEGLEKQHPKTKTEKSSIQLPLLDFAEEESVPNYLQDLEKALQDIDLLRTTPLEAMQKLENLKNHLPIQ